jgi:hypothetical protein
MFDAATKAVEKVAGIGRSKFDRDETLRLVLTYLLQIIGEAALRGLCQISGRPPRNSMEGDHRDAPQGCARLLRGR